MAHNLSQAFCVVKFSELPFEGIDDYVYVPDNWLRFRRGKRAVVSYPNDEDPFDTRNRVKRQERYNDNWRLYIAVIKYETNTYRDAELWIAARKCRPSIEEKSRITDTILNDNPLKSLPGISIKRLTPSEPKNQLDRKRLRLGEAALSSSNIVNDTNVEPNCSNKEQYIIIKDEQPMKYAQTEETTAASKGDDSSAPRTQPPYIEQNRQALSLPVIDVDIPTEVIITDDEDHLQGVKQPDKNNIISQRHLSEDTTAASITATEPSTSGNLTSQPYQHNNREYVLDGDSSSSNLQIQIENVRSIAKRLMNITRNSEITEKNASNLMDHRSTGSMSTHLVKQSSVVTQNQSQDGQRVLETHTENIRNQTAPLRINMEQNSTNPSNLLYQTSELPQQRQSQPNQQDPQQQPQRPKKCVTSSTKPKNKTQMPTFQGVTKKMPPPVLSNNLNPIRQALSTFHDNDLLNEQQLQARRSTKSTEHNHTGLTTSPQNIRALATRDKQTSELPSCSFYQPPRIQHTISQDNVYQNLRMQEQLVNLSTTTNPNLNRVHFEDDITNSAINESHLNVIKVGKRAHDVATVDSRNILQNVNNTTSASQNHSSSSNRHPSFVLYQTSELLQRRQSQPNQQASQQQAQTPKKRVRNSTKPKNKTQMPTLQEITKKTPPSVLLNDLNSIQALSISQNNDLLNKQQLQARQNTKSTEHNHTGLTISPQNIASSATNYKQNSELNSCSFDQPPRIQDTTAPENLYQRLRTHEQLVNQSTTTNSKLKRVHFEDDITNSAVNESHLNVMDKTSQIEECMVEKTQSPYHVVNSDSDTGTDHEIIPDHEMSTHESLVETTNNVYCTGTTSGSSSADRPTIVQAPTTSNYHRYPGDILEQQILDNFATLLTQAGSTLRYMCDMYNKSRRLILEMAETYKKLLKLFERFNTVGNSASNTSPLRNTISEVPLATEGSVRLHSGNKNKNSNSPQSAEK
ncbi:unnamed protein product [Euphydryas editha]|uniref:BEN domain-containing protein n=1 Tax=Euphydryas editha TaxID=104508 RepID=A0AAU9TGS4_EUPED|nr:unnamed protein product [Euphydryas editha]